MSRFRLPSPAMMVALLALFVALSGTAVGASVIVPLAKRALVADNAKKLGGASLKQIVGGIGAAIPTLLRVQIQPWSLPPGGALDFTVSCSSGEKAISGGFENTSRSGVVLAIDTRPSSDGASWKIVLLNLSSSAGQSGSLYAVCIA